MALPQSLKLPINTVLDDLTRTLEVHCRAVLQAPPGTGKTTGVPLALLRAAWLKSRKIVLLAPRRLAARAAAMRMAAMRGETVGQTVGYRVRMDACVGPATRIEVVTEGVLTRMLQGDPSLAGVGLVIFDEFHERSLDADLGLALCLDMQGVLNADLRLLVMSATLETGPVAALLDDAPVIACPGRMFPVRTRYVGRHTPVWSPDTVIHAIRTAVAEESGSILVFLPGVREIRQTAERLAASGLEAGCIVAPLYGNLSRRDQDRAIAPPPDGRRKIVLATAIAETSLTIEGVRIVIDCGLQRVPRFDVRSGLTRLVTLPVSQASAAQRRGRAGRMGPGICLRLWSAAMQGALPLALRPEILEADLTAPALELALWGETDPARLKWLDPPTPQAFAQARKLLQILSAIDQDGRITSQGCRMAALPLHPRLARMVIAADGIGQAGAACDLAALLSERDILRSGPGRRDIDIRKRFDLLQAARNRPPETVCGARPDQGALQRVLRAANDLRRRCKYAKKRGGDVPVGVLLAWAYPDRIARRRSVRGRYLLANGHGASLDTDSALASEEFIVAAELDGDRREARIYKAAAYSRAQLVTQFAADLHWAANVAWDPARKGVAAERVLRLGALSLDRQALPKPDDQAVLAALIEGLRQQGLACLPWTKTLRRWQQRVCFLHRSAPNDANWPDVSDAGLTARLTHWLAPFLTGMSRLRDLQRLDLKAALFGLLPYEKHALLEQLAPTHQVVPSGSRLPIDYRGEVPVLAVRLQELFGLNRTPAVAGGRQPLLLHLLSPAGRPVQITQDLQGFWQNGYPEVKKELKGRHPKHYWPDDPMQAEATARAKPAKK